MPCNRIDYGKYESSNIITFLLKQNIFFISKNIFVFNFSFKMQIIFNHI